MKKDGTLISEIPDEGQQDPRNISNSTAVLSEKDLQAKVDDKKEGRAGGVKNIGKVVCILLVLYKMSQVYKYFRLSEN